MLETDGEGREGELRTLSETMSAARNCHTPPLILRLSSNRHPASSGCALFAFFVGRAARGGGVGREESCVLFDGEVV